MYLELEKIVSNNGTIPEDNVLEIILFKVYVPWAREDS